jgi:metal-responsive CopG/Arc/MetJ family transcriptional regulator
METVILIPDDIYRQAEELAATLGMSRSELYATALAEFLGQQRDEYITEHLNQVYAETDSEVDAVIKQLQTVSLPVERW